MIPHAQNLATQRGRILAVPLNAKGGWVPLSQILDLQISQFGTRILELRRSGFTIENEQETVGGQRRSRYRILLGADRQPRSNDSNVGIIPPPQQPAVAPVGTFPEFGDIAPGGGGYPD